MIAMINRVVSAINRVAGATAALLLFYVLVHIIYEIILRNWTRGSVSESIAEVPLWIPVGAVWLGLIFLMLQLFAYFLRVAAGGNPIDNEGTE